MVADRAGALIADERELLQCLQCGGPWDRLANVVVRLWLRQSACEAVAVLGLQRGDAVAGVLCHGAEGGELQTGQVSAQAGISGFVSQRLFRELVETAGFSSPGIQCYLWPDLLCGLVVDPGQQFQQSLAHVADLQALTRQLLARVSGRAVLLPDPSQMEAMAEFAAGAGHEINNPLATIIGQSQLQLRGAAGIDLRQSLETIGAQAWRIRDMIGNAMLFARPPELRVQAFRLRGLVEECLGTIRQAAPAGVLLRCDCPVDPELTADRAQMGGLICHLLRNSCDAMRGSGRTGNVSLSCRTVADCLELQVRDDGPGLGSAEVLTHAFDPFFSGRSAGRGLGFGLCLAWQIVRQHGGAICLEDVAGQGLCCHVSIPLCRAVV
ncbi:MAG TPA: hypothetical protein DIT89_05535 [Planctomycetaceae bacterium]|nr:hypothetical protein [Planctomycetaceae bacterium]